MSKFRTENPTILGASVQNLVTGATWHAGCVHPWAVYLTGGRRSIGSRNLLNNSHLEERLM
jgi:hypothetical protein